MSVPVPRWSAVARWRDAGPVALECRGEPLAALLAAGIVLTPVEYLLISAAGCYAMSLEGARRAAQLPAATFEVTALGSKADGTPSRLAALRLVIRIDGAIGADDQPALLAAAKSMCTVTNTLGATPTVDIARR